MLFCFVAGLVLRNRSGKFIPVFLADSGSGGWARRIRLWRLRPSPGAARAFCRPRRASWPGMARRPPRRPVWDKGCCTQPTGSKQPPTLPPCLLPPGHYERLCTAGFNPFPASGSLGSVPGSAPFGFGRASLLGRSPGPAEEPLSDLPGTASCRLQCPVLPPQGGAHFPKQQSQVYRRQDRLCGMERRWPVLGPEIFVHLRPRGCFVVT